MTERERFLAAFEGRATDRPPAYEQAFASDVASGILGREAYTGSVMLHYQEAVAAVRGPEAHREFLERMERDVVDLAKALKFGAVAGPWTLGPPTKQVGEYEFLYGDPEEDARYLAGLVDVEEAEQRSARGSNDSPREQKGHLVRKTATSRQPRERGSRGASPVASSP